MADFAEECGFSIPESEIDACIEEQADESSDDKRYCSDFGDAETIRNNWTCEELEVYWGPEPEA
jgi:hypothetical protein